MRKFLTYLLILTAVPLYAQDEQLDSLNSIIQESQDASTVFEAMIAASQYQAGFDNNDSRNYALKALKNAEERQSDPDRALAYKWIGISFYYQLNPFEALENFENAFVLFEKVGNKSGMANMRQLQAETNTLEGDANRGLELGLEALALINQTDDEYRKASIMVALGNAYNDKEESSDEAISYYKQALPIFERIEYAPGVGNVLQNLGDAYRTKGQYQQAREYYYKSLEAHDDPYEAPSKLRALGITYMQLGMFDEAAQHLHNSKTMAAKNEAELEVAQALIAEAALAFQKKDLRGAEDSYREALAIIKQQSSSEADYKIELREAYEGLSVVL
jgi:tetratricopeptide (TPR) repeat protein